MSVVALTVYVLILFVLLVITVVKTILPGVHIKGQTQQEIVQKKKNLDCVQLGWPS